MADTVQFDLVSPERRLASFAATAIQIPAAAGDMTAMADHAPTITTLRPGILKVTHDGTTDEYVVSGGFAEISQQSVSVLAERSVHRDEMNQELFDSFLAEIRAQHEKAQATTNAEPGVVDEIAKLLADMVAIGEEMNFRAG